MREAVAAGLAGERHLALLNSLSRRIDETLGPLVPADRPVALLDFPRVPNVGDSAIWLGAVAFLARRGIRPAYTCSNRTYSRAALARRIGDGTILLTGGGNFGDLYPPHQELREAVVRDFPGHRIVQLPQTIRFESRDTLERARAAFDAHPDVTLLVRDASSLAIARASFRATSALCPDMALALGPMPRPAAPTHPVVWLARVDKEAASSHQRGVPPGVRRVDWLSDDPSPVLQVNGALSRLLGRRPGLRGTLQAPLSWTYAPAARERMDRGVRLLGSGRVVVSDRLHGHILSLLLGIPHVVLDNSYGKVRGFYEAWTRDSEIAEWSDDAGEALARARSLAESLAA